MGAILTFIGLSGLPDDLENWRIACLWAAGKLPAMTELQIQWLLGSVGVLLVVVPEAIRWWRGTDAPITEPWLRKALVHQKGFRLDAPYVLVCMDQLKTAGLMTRGGVGKFLEAREIESALRRIYERLGRATELDPVGYCTWGPPLYRSPRGERRAMEAHLEDLISRHSEFTSPVDLLKPEPAMSERQRISADILETVKEIEQWVADCYAQGPNHEPGELRFEQYENRRVEEGRVRFGSRLNEFRKRIDALGARNEGFLASATLNQEVRTLDAFRSTAQSFRNIAERLSESETSTNTENTKRKLEVLRNDFSHWFAERIECQTDEPRWLRSTLESFHLRFDRRFTEIAEDIRALKLGNDADYAAQWMGHAATANQLLNLRCIPDNIGTTIDQINQAQSS